MSNTVNISFKVDKKLKKQADDLFRNLGINTSIALNMFLNQCIMEQGIPFNISMKVPNEKLISALEEVEAIENGKNKAKRYETFEDVLKDLS